MKIKFRAVGSNSVSMGYCKRSIKTHIARWCAAHSVAEYIIGEVDSTTVTLEFPDEKLYSLFVLTWESKNLSYLKPEIFGKI